MYQILLGRDGRYHCLVGVQDGSERATRKTRREAVATVVSIAKTLNNDTITEKDIYFCKEVEVVETKIVEVPMRRR